MSSNNRKNIFNENPEDLLRYSIQNAQRTNDLNNLPVFDSRFTTINSSGHSTTMPSTLGDVNDSGNTNWIMPATSTTLSVVSTSAQDGVAGTGLNMIQLRGLDQNLDEISEFIVTNGTTPVISNLSYRSMHLAIAFACGTHGSGSVGQIDITSSFDASVWGTFRVNDTSAETGRFVVPNNKRFLFTGTVYNVGDGGDMTLKAELTIPGVCPFSLAEGYINGSFNTISGLSNIFLESGYVFKFRGFTNSGAPSTRKMNTGIFGVLASVDAWNSLQI